MKALFLTVALCCTPPVFCQPGDPIEISPPSAEAQEQDTQQQQKADDGQQPQQQQSDRTVIDVKPGGAALKSKDFYERTGYFHPFVRMPKYILADQRRIWTSPFHTSKNDVKWWLIFGGATAGLIVADR